MNENSPRASHGANVRITVSNRDLPELRASLQCGHGATASWGRSWSDQWGSLQPASRRLSGQRNRIASVASHDARHPFPLEVWGPRLYPPARPRLAFPIIPTPLIQSPSLRRRAAMLAIPAAKAPRMAAPAPLVIVPTPVLGSIVTTTTLPGGVLLGAGAGTGTGTGTDTGLPGTGLKGGGSQQIGTGPAIVSPTPMALPALPPELMSPIETAPPSADAFETPPLPALLVIVPPLPARPPVEAKFPSPPEASAMAVPPSALTEMIVSLITSPPSMITPPTALPQAS